MKSRRRPGGGGIPAPPHFRDAGMGQKPPAREQKPEETGLEEPPNPRDGRPHEHLDRRKMANAKFAGEMDPRLGPFKIQKKEEGPPHRKERKKTTPPGRGRPPPPGGRFR